MKKLLAVLFILLIIFSCKKEDESTESEENSLVTQIITPIGGSIGTADGIEIIFPIGALSVDTEVTVGYDGTEPTTFPNPNVDIIGKVFTIKINADSLNKTAILKIPKPEGYTNLNETIILISDGTTFFPLFFEEDSKQLVAQLDYLNYTQVYDTIINNRNTSGVGSYLTVWIIKNLQTPPLNQMGLKKVDLDINNEMTFSTVPTLNSTDKVLIMVHGWTGSPSPAWSSFLNKIKPQITTSDYTHYLTFGYNSGLSINDNGIILSDILQTTINGAKVDFVTHSMGGLVARSAIENHNCEEIVSNLITLGTPHQGSPAAVLRYFLGFTIGVIGVDPSAYISYNVNTQGFRDLNTFSTFLTNLNNNPAPITNYYPISAIKDLHHLNDGVVRKPSALGIQNNDNLLIGSTFMIPGLMPHIKITKNDGIILNVAVMLNSYTDPTIPILTTSTIIFITATSATSGGYITNNGGSPITERGVCWNTIGTPTTGDEHTIANNNTANYLGDLTDLIPNTTYYVRAYAINSLGIAYGNELEFTTLASGNIPAVTTTSITGITENTATSGGNVTDEGGSAIIYRGVCWSTESNPTTIDNITTDGTGTGSFTSYLTGLTENTTYYVRAYATNIEGTAYGDEKEFNTVNGSLYDGNVNLSTQQEVDDFGANGYTVINGSLSIGTNVNNNISDISSLNTILSVSDGLWISNTQLSSLMGLSSLQNISTSIGINYNDYLTDISQLSNAALNINSLGFTDNAILTNLNGINNINSLSGDLILSGNLSLSNISALQSLSNINGSLIISGNTTLTNIDALNNLTNIDGSLSINSNSNLLNIDGLNNLVQLNGGISISGNLLTNLNAFSNLTSVGSIGLNEDNLTDISGFSNLQTITGSISLGSRYSNYNNQNLENASFPSLISCGGIGMSKMNSVTTVNFPNLQTLGGLRIFINHEITSMDFSSLTSITGDVWISNTGLTLESFSNLTSIDGDVWLGEKSNYPYNPHPGVNTFETLNGLDNLISINGTLVVNDNNNLINLCALQNLLINSGITGGLYIIDNAFNPTEQDIIDGNCSQ